MRPATLVCLLTLLAALLVATAQPAQAQTSGQTTMECLTLKWQVVGDNVEVEVILNGEKVDSITLTANDPIKQFDRPVSGCSAQGRLTLFAKSTWGSGKLNVDVTIKKGSDTFRHSGTLATW
ncbi:MAG: hypothetical protein KJ720_13125 [Proteobacteria bacterium]|nr:hypothetical protein [Pseudomonadota bacterium]